MNWSVHSIESCTSGCESTALYSQENNLEQSEMPHNHKNFDHSEAKKPPTNVVVSLRLKRPTGSCSLKSICLEKLRNGPSWILLLRKSASRL